jgi:hypothetical protein
MDELLFKKDVFKLNLTKWDEGMLFNMEGSHPHFEGHYNLGEEVSYEFPV